MDHRRGDVIVVGMVPANQPAWSHAAAESHRYDGQSQLNA